MVLTCRNHSVPVKVVGGVQNNEAVVETIARFVTEDSGLLCTKNLETNIMAVPHLGLIMGLPVVRDCRTVTSCLVATAVSCVIFQTQRHLRHFSWN